MQRVTRPKGGINERLRWLSVPLHRRVDRFLRQIIGHEFIRLGAKPNSWALPSADNAGDSDDLGIYRSLQCDTRITFITYVLITE